MTRYLSRLVRLCLVVVLIIGLTPEVVRADGGQDISIRLFATATYGPIGRVMWNLPGSKAAINGVFTDGEQAIWNGDVIEATGNASVRVWLDSVGQVMLKSGARAKLAVTLTSVDDNIARRVLIASLISGDMVVKLERDTTAYIESCGSAFTSSNGANFHLGVRKGKAAFDVANGAVWAEALLPQPPAIISRVGFERNTGRPVDLGNDPVKQKHNKPGATGGSVHSEQLAFRVKGRKGAKTRKILFRLDADLTETQTAQDEEPIADTTLLFELSPADIGSVSPQRMRTDAQGIARTAFTAGPNPKTGKLKVTAEELGSFREFDVFVLPGFWTTRNKILIGVAAAAAVVTCIVGCGPNPKPPLRQEPPPVIP